MRIYIVAYNDGEYIDTAHLVENTHLPNITTKKQKQMVFRSYDRAKEHAESWAKDIGSSVSTRPGSGGVTIFIAEMEDAVKYIAKPDEWFDAGTEAELIDDYRPRMNSGLFRGIYEGKSDEEVCSFEEFEITFKVVI